MYIQADDENFYKDPILYDKLHDWYIIPIKEDNFKFCTIYTSLIPVMNSVIEQHGVFFKKISKISNDLRPFPPDWLDLKTCKTSYIEFIKKIPSQLITKESKKINQDLVSGFNPDVITFEWKFTYDEVKAIYSGTIRPTIYKGLTKQTLQSRIRKQLNIKSISNLQKGSYTLHK